MSNDIKKFLGEKVIYDDDGQFIWAVEKSGRIQKLADLRGWGAIMNLFIQKSGAVDLPKAAQFQNDLGIFIADAINEKLAKA